MGQYSEWLRYREADQQLQAQRTRLERDLNDLQKQVRSLEIDHHHAHNSIVQALQQHIPTTPTSTQPAVLTPNTPPAHYPPVPRRSTSTAIPVVPPYQAWMPLPGVTGHRKYTNSKIPIQAAALKTTQLTSTPSTLPAAPLQRTNNMHTFTPQDTPHQGTLSQSRQIARSSPRTLPVDQQSEHTDQHIQRWLERWGKYEPNIQDTQKDARYE